MDTRRHDMAMYHLAEIPRRLFRAMPRAPFAPDAVLIMLMPNASAKTREMRVDYDIIGRRMARKSAHEVQETRDDCHAAMRATLYAIEARDTFYIFAAFHAIRYAYALH